MNLLITWLSTKVYNIPWDLKFLARYTKLAHNSWHLIALLHQSFTLNVLGQHEMASFDQSPHHEPNSQYLKDHDHSTPATRSTRSQRQKMTYIIAKCCIALGILIASIFLLLKELQTSPFTSMDWCIGLILGRKFNLDPFFRVYIDRMLFSYNQYRDVERSPCYLVLESRSWQPTEGLRQLPHTCDSGMEKGTQWSERSLQQLWSPLGESRKFNVLFAPSLSKTTKLSSADRVKSRREGRQGRQGEKGR